MEASVVIRTYNEARWLPQVFEALARQDLDGRPWEIVVVDSGSTDDSRALAAAAGARIVDIAKSEFTFGRSLNVGCEAAQGRALVFISGHCIPVGERWLADLIAPLGRDGVAYTYGRQVGHDELTKFSERQLFAKYFPDHSAVPQEGFFCNNANAAVLRELWAEARFDETLTGLEDMELAKRLVAAGHRVGYVAEAPVVHVHEENWRKIRVRYEREAIALQAIMPEVHLSFGDFLRYTASAVLLDWGEAIKGKCFLREAWPVVMFRTMQFWGAYRGNNDHRKLSQRKKEAYFYPR